MSFIAVSPGERWYQSITLVVSSIMAAGNLQVVTRVCDEVRGRLTDVKTQTNT